MGRRMPSLRFRPAYSPLQGFVGMNGGGKSALAVDTVLRQAAETGLPIYSNIALNAPEFDVRRVRGLSDLLEISYCHILYDEIASVAPARDSMAQSPAIVLRLASLRHQHATLVWTAPVLEDVDVKIRRVTQQITAVKAVYGRKVVGEPWPETRLSFAKSYDFRSELTVTINTDTRVTDTGFLRLAGLRLDAYDTHEDVELVADHAVCLDCGLPKRREYCKGHHHSDGITSIPEAKAPEPRLSSRPHATPATLAGAGARPLIRMAPRLDSHGGGATLEGSR